MHCIVWGALAEGGKHHQQSRYGATFQEPEIGATIPESCHSQSAASAKLVGLSGLIHLAAPCPVRLGLEDMLQEVEEREQRESTAALAEWDARFARRKLTLAQLRSIAGYGHK